MFYKGRFTMTDDKRRKPQPRPLDLILRNKKGCQAVLQYIVDNGGKVRSSVLRVYALQFAATPAYRDNLINALFTCACIDRVGLGDDRSYEITIHGEDLLESFKKVR